MYYLCKQKQEKPTQLNNGSK